jgi:hypothetical protein
VTVTRKRVALLLALLALGVAGCGGDDESETVPPAPELSLPGEDTPTLEDLPGSTTSTDSTTGTDTAPGGGGEVTPPPATPQEPGGQQPPSGGQPAPGDTPENDTPPPPGSPAERFEQFCQENPGAC